MTIKSALREMNNAVLDLQMADHNTYVRPLQRIAQSLTSDDLKAITMPLKEQVDLDAFIAGATHGGMAGSSRLNWPVDREEELGLAMCMIERGAEDPTWFRDFAIQFYYAGRTLTNSIRKITSSVVIPFSRDFAIYVEERYIEENPPTPTAVQVSTTNYRRIFIVHGHDEGPRETVARFISNLGLEPVILHEQANRGMTTVEKLEANRDVGYVVVLLTPDDLGRGKLEEEDKPRARQNVILELGYFLGFLGRERVTAIRKGQVEIPSDYMGVVYTPFDDGGGWRQQLGRDLKTAGYKVDWNRVMD